MQTKNKGACSDKFVGNLMLTDSRMEEIISIALMIFFRDNINSCVKVVMSAAFDIQRVFSYNSTC